MNRSPTRYNFFLTAGRAVALLQGKRFSAENAVTRKRLSHIKVWANVLAFAEKAKQAVTYRAAFQQNPFQRRKFETMTKDEETRAGGSAETKDVEGDSQDMKQDDRSASSADSNEQGAERAGGSAETKGVV